MKARGACSHFYYTIRHSCYRTNKCIKLCSANMMNIEDQTRNPLYMLNKTWNDDDDDTVCTENSIKTDKKKSATSEKNRQE